MNFNKMSDLENSNDLTQEMEISDIKQNGFLPTDESINTRDEDNQIEMNIGQFDVVSSISTSNTKLVLSVYGNDLRVKNPTKIGNVFSFLFINGDPIIILGPQYYMSIVLFIIINFINALLIYFAYQHLHFIIKYSGLLIYLIQVISQLYCTLINPGIPHRNNYVSDSLMHTIYQNIKHNNYKFDKYRVCKRCNILVTVDQTVTHCEDCNICVEDLDHHCVWIGKCIAKRNILSFNIFIVSTILFGICAVISLMGMVITKATIRN